MRLDYLSFFALKHKYNSMISINVQNLSTHMEHSEAHLLWTKMYTPKSKREMFKDYIINCASTTGKIACSQQPFQIHHHPHDGTKLPYT